MFEETDQSPPTSVSSARTYKITIAVLALALAAALTAALLSFLRPAFDRADSEDDNPLAGARFTRITDFEGAEYDAAISPDGRFVAFLPDRDGPFRNFLDKDAVTVAWSPDGAQIVYHD